MVLPNADGGATDPVASASHAMSSYGSPDRTPSSDAIPMKRAPTAFVDVTSVSAVGTGYGDWLLKL